MKNIVEQTHRYECREGVKTIIFHGDMTWYAEWLTSLIIFMIGCSVKHWDTEDGLTGGTSHTDADYSCLTPATRPTSLATTSATSSSTTSTSLLNLFILFLKIY